MTEMITLPRNAVARAAWRLYLTSLSGARLGNAATAEGCADRARPLLIALRDSALDAHDGAAEVRKIYDDALRVLNGETLAKTEG